MGREEKYRKLKTQSDVGSSKLVLDLTCMCPSKPTQPRQTWPTFKYKCETNTLYTWYKYALRISILNDKSVYPALLTMPQSPFSPVFSLINLEKSLIPLLALHWFCCITNVQCPKSISCTRLQIYVCVDLAVSFQSSSLVTSNWITYHRENIFKILSFQNAKHLYKK